MPDFNTLNSIKSKLKADDERKIRGLSFARLYYANKDYQKALTFVNDYLSIKNNSAEGYKLLGDVYEALNNNEKSLESYKKSYYIDKNQEGILFKICEKLETLDSVDTQTIKTWLDRLEKKYPNHKSVFILKDKLELENGNCSSRLEDTFRDLSNVKLSDLTDDKCANLSCSSFLNARSPALTPNQFKSLERSQDRLFKKVIEIEENFNKTTNQIFDIVKENQTMYAQLKNEIDKINPNLAKLQLGQSEIKETIDLFKENQTMHGQIKSELDTINASLNKLQLGQNEIKETMDEYMSGNYEDADEEDDENAETEEETNENDPISSFLSCNSTNNQQNTSDVFSRLGPSPNKQTSTNNSFIQQVSQQPFSISNNNQLPQTSPQLNQAIGNLQINQSPSGLLFQSPPQVPFSNVGVLASKDDKSPLGPLNQMINRIPTGNLNKTTAVTANQSPNVPLSELYKNQNVGKWKCSVCLLTNDLNKDKCASCETVNPSLPVKTTTVANQNPNVPLSELYKNQNVGKWKCSVCLLTNDLNKDKCASCETVNPSLPVKTPTVASKPFQLETGSKGGFSFTESFNQATSQQTTDNKFVFGVPSSQNTNQVKEASKFTFNSSLLFGQQPQLPPVNLSPLKQQQTTPSSSNAASTIGQTPFSLSNTSSGFVFGNQNTTSIQLNTPIFGLTPSNILSSAASNNKSVISPFEDKKPTISEQADVEEEPQIDFTPVIPLPPKVEVVTGEEDEKVLFAHRAKLYRFADNEWKERGLGEMKVLFDEKNNKYRLLMRRDQIHKVCLNAPILPELKFEEGSNQSGTALKWACFDFSEDKCKTDIFSVKFKTKELTERFKSEVLKIVAILNDKTSTQSSVSNEKAVTEKELSKFDDLEIVYEKKPKSSEDEEKAKKLKLPINFFNFEGLKECPGCNGCKDYIPKLAYEIENKQDKKDDNEEENNQENSNNLFSVAIAESGNTKKSNWTKSDQPIWMKSALTPIFSKTNENDPETEIDTLDFKPIIPLPDLIKVRTGEEDEEALFSTRAKLYKFTKGEWKERGIGDFKVLKHKQTQKIRFLMRREQVHKICLNHLVDKSIKIGLRKGREKIYGWSATDFSENKEGDPSIFNIKFKNKEIGNQLIKTLQDNIEGFEELKD